MGNKTTRTPFWTNERIDKLEIMAKTLTADEMGAKFGKTRSSIRNVCKRNHIPIIRTPYPSGHKRNRWDDEKIAVLLEKSIYMNIDQLADYFDTTYSVIQRLLVKHKVAGKNTIKDLVRIHKDNIICKKWIMP